MTHSASAPSEYSALLLLAGVVVLLLMGGILLGYSTRIRKQELARRIALVDLKVGLPSDKSAVRETLLLHGAASALPEREQRALVRLIAALHMRQEYASKLLLSTRFGFVALLGLGALALGLRWHA